MITVIAVISLILYVLGFGFVLQQILRARFEYLLYYCVIFLPIYAVFLNLTYTGTGIRELVVLLQYSKEIVFFSCFFILLFGGAKFIDRQWDLSTLDKSLILFVMLAGSFLILPIGEASFLSKLVYFKNLLLLPIFYFFGRNIKLDIGHWRKAYKILFGLILCTTAVVVLEKVMGVHLHAVLDWSRYQLDVYDNEVGGIFGIGFTFEAQGGKPRYGSFFAHPLELSASMLLPVALSIYLLLNVRFRENKVKYFMFLGTALLCVVLAYSRATFVAFFIMIIYMAFLLRYYKILFSAFLAAIIFTLYVFYFASEDLRYFVIDTITFQNSSSITHLIDWAEAVESMIANPLGIGLGTSGNVSGVEEELSIGGENQFLIFGVQMGVIGMLLYICILYLAIRDSAKAYKFADTKEERIIPFVAASVKIGLLLPLFTANVEAYLFISLVSWWLVGYSETKYRSYILKRRKSRIRMKPSIS